MTQYVVAAFLDGTLSVDATGPFRSEQKAEALCDRLNAASEWSENDPDGPTLIAQVVRLRPASELLAAMSGQND